ncbi:cell division protein FtsQ/DivIB [Clostridium hydrogeniformans]|uniref:cell division protein FtsQ/DivIB n=1 Tax=Clostridium hydrogeniformans TaxID=349933 RepID=UPI00048968B9|nr:FtsQ-type POTRA domain-containing protein [Clostridium hydrogeniformans]
MKKAINEVYSKETLKKRKFKRSLKKVVFFMIFMVAILITVAIKAPFFNISTIFVENNKIVSNDEILQKSPIKTGHNIFYFNKNNIIKSIQEIPYIEKVKIERQLPKTIILKVKEREAFFYGIFDKTYYVFDKDMRVLEKRDNLEGLNLVNVTGFDYSNVEVGHTIQDESVRKNDLIKDISKLLAANVSTIQFTSINIEDPLSIKFGYKDIEIRIGTEDGLKEKLNKVLNILIDREDVRNGKGYIDVSFNGNPVVYLEG